MFFIVSMFVFYVVICVDEFESVGREFGVSFIGGGVDLCESYCYGVCL